MRECGQPGTTEQSEMLHEVTETSCQALTCHAYFQTPLQPRADALGATQHSMEAWPLQHLNSIAAWLCCESFDEMTGWME